MCNSKNSQVFLKEKVKSWLYTDSFLCTHVFSFREQNNTWALARAKANVIRWYPIVGLLDYMEESLNALAIEFPYFFKGAIHIYNQFRKYYFYQVYCPYIYHIYHAYQFSIIFIIFVFCI